MRSGDYSGLPTIVDPLTESPFPGNRIPAGRIDSRSQTLIQKVVLPNQAGTGIGGTVNNLAVNIKNDSDINRYFVRVDHRFNEKDSVWFTGNISKANPYFVAQAFPPGFGSWDNGGNDTRVGNFTWNHTLSPRVLNEARLGYTYHGPVRQGQNRDFDPRSIFPDLYGPLPLGGLPKVTVTGFASIGDYGGSERGS